MVAPGQDEGLRTAYRYAGLGMQFAGGTLMFAGVGFLLDRWLHILPALTVLGMLVGGVLSFLSVYRKVMADQEKKP
jgi:F0F1-type ATP synthase assembly protein I